MRPALVLALLTACRVVPTASRAPTAVSATPPALRASLDAALASAGPREAVLVAAAAGDATAVARLIAAGADGDAAPDPMDEDFAWTPLTAARARNHRAVVDLLERAHALEACHVFARARTPLDLRRELDAPVEATLPAATRVVVLAAKRGSLRVMAYVPGQFRAGEGAVGWTDGALAPELADPGGAAHPNGPHVGGLPGALRVIGCHAYAARVVAGDGRASWVRAVHGPGWGG